MSERGAYVGISLYHTVGDRERALEQLHTGFAQLQDEVMKAAGWSADPYHEASGPIWDWWKLAGIPVVDEWQKFYADQTGSWWGRFAAAWEVYEQWQGRLVALREQVKAHGAVKLASPDPAPLGETLPGKILDAGEHAVSKAASAVGDTWTFVKVGAYAALGLAGVIVLGSAVHALKSGQAPAQPYWNYARGRR